MIDRPFFLIASFIACLSHRAIAADSSGTYPIPVGMTRLTVERSDEPLLYRQDTLIALNGRPTGTLARGAKIQIDLPPGTWRISAKTHPTAEQSMITLTLHANTESRVRVELDPVRFPPQGNAFELGNLLRQSLDAPSDDRQALFRLRQIAPEIPEGGR